MNPRSALAALAALSLAAGGLSACGGSDKKDSSTGARGYSADEPAAVKKVFTDYLAAIRAGDYEKACSYDSKEAIKKIEQTGGTCAALTEKATKLVGNEVFANAKIDEPKVSGDTATVHYVVVAKGQTVPADQKLVKEDGEWKLASPGA